ncbi:hypothetical protein GCM10009844_44040 [Nocardioides koreensis]|uniref:Transposase n=1 Tax=Nocardioides koreensis TaxID=433651 RepID=A0ABN3A8C2_9ACTN
MFNAPGKRGRKHAEDLRSVVDAMSYIAQTGCQWRYPRASPPAPRRGRSLTTPVPNRAECGS